MSEKRSWGDDLIPKLNELDAKVEKLFSDGQYLEAAGVLREKLDVLEGIERSSMPDVFISSLSNTHASIGLCALRRGDLDTAEGAVNRALSLAGDNAHAKHGALRLKGRLHEERQNWSRAAATYEQVIALGEPYGTSREDRIALARVRERLGNRDGAFEAYVMAATGVGHGLGDEFDRELLSQAYRGLVRSALDWKQRGGALGFEYWTGPGSNWKRWIPFGFLVVVFGVSLILAIWEAVRLQASTAAVLLGVAVVAGVLLVLPGARSVSVRGVAIDAADRGTADWSITGLGSGRRE